MGGTKCAWLAARVTKVKSIISTGPAPPDYSPHTDLPGWSPKGRKGRGAASGSPPPHPQAEAAGFPATAGLFGVKGAA